MWFNFGVEVTVGCLRTVSLKVVWGQAMVWQSLLSADLSALRCFPNHVPFGTDMGCYLGRKIMCVLLGSPGVCVSQPPVPRLYIVPAPWDVFSLTAAKFSEHIPTLMYACRRSFSFFSQSPSIKTFQDQSLLPFSELIASCLAVLYCESSSLCLQGVCAGPGGRYVGQKHHLCSHSTNSCAGQASGSTHSLSLHQPLQTAASNDATSSITSAE